MTLKFKLLWSAAYLYDTTGYWFWTRSVRRVGARQRNGARAVIKLWFSNLILYVQRKTHSRTTVRWCACTSCCWWRCCWPGSPCRCCCCWAAACSSRGCYISYKGYLITVKIYTKIFAFLSHNSFCSNKIRNVGIINLNINRMLTDNQLFWNVIFYLFLLFSRREIFVTICVCINTY